MVSPLDLKCRVRNKRKNDKRRKKEKEKGKKEKELKFPFFFYLFIVYLGGVQNVTFRNCKLHKVVRGCYLKTSTGIKEKNEKTEIQKNANISGIRDKNKKREERREKRT